MNWAGIYLPVFTQENRSTCTFQRHNEGHHILMHIYSQIPISTLLKLVQATSVVAPRRGIVVRSRWISAAFRDRQVNLLCCFACIQTIIKTFNKFAFSNFCFLLQS